MIDKSEKILFELSDKEEEVLAERMMERLADSVLELSNEEIITEAREAGIDREEDAAATRSVLQEALEKRSSATDNHLKPDTSSLDSSTSKEVSVTTDKVESKKIRVLIVEGTRMASRLLADGLGHWGSLEIVGATSNRYEALRGIAELHPDVVLISDVIDDQPGRGFELAKQIRNAHRPIKIVVLLDSGIGEAVVDSFLAGARGVFTRNQDVQTLATCVSDVARGTVWASSDQLAYVLDTLSATPTRRFNPAELHVLSKREHEVVAALVEGLSNREIAERMHISRHTVKNYIFRIFDKLGMSSRLELVATLGRLKEGAASMRGIGLRLEEGESSDELSRARGRIPT